MLKRKLQKLMMLCLAFMGMSNAWAQEVKYTLDFADNPWGLVATTQNNDMKSSSNVEGLEFNGIVFSTDKGSATYYPSFRYNSSYNDGDPFLSLYKGNKFTISAPEGYGFTKMVFNYVSYTVRTSTTYYNGQNTTDEIGWSEGSYLLNADNKAEGTWTKGTNPATEVVMTMNAGTAAWIRNIEFTLAPAGEGGGSEPIAVPFSFDSATTNGALNGTTITSIGNTITLQNPEGTSIASYDSSKNSTLKVGYNQALTLTPSVTGGVVTLAIPSTNLSIEGTWTLSIPAGAFTDTKGNTNKTASFNWTVKSAEPQKYTISKKGNVSNGKIFIDGVELTETMQVTEGQRIQITAVPDENYQFSGWSIDPDAYTPDADGYLTMPAANISISAFFTEKPAAQKYAIEIALGIQGGTVEASKTEAAAGDIISLNATPAPGYEFQSWNVVDDRNNPIIVTGNQFTMPAIGVFVDASFKKKTSSTGWSFAEANISPAPGSTVESLSKITFAYSDISELNAGLDGTGYYGQQEWLSDGTNTYVVNASDDYNYHVYQLTLATPITKPGTYTLTIPANVLYPYHEPTSVHNTEMTFTWTIVAPTPENVEIPITAAGYATYVTEYALDFTNSAIEAFAVTEVNPYAGKMTLTKLTQVPAEQAIIVKGETGNVPVIESAAEIDNYLAFSPEDINVTDSEWAGMSFYGLANGSNGVGFYPVTTGTIKAGKGFLAASGIAANAKGLVFDFGDATGINNVKAMESNVMFNLAGQRIMNANGLVIKNGKKYVK